MLLMKEKGIKGGIWHSICWYAKANKKNAWKTMIKIKSHIFNTGV